MKIPTTEPMQVAPKSVAMPARGVTQPTGFNAIDQGMAQLGQAADNGMAVYQKELKAAEAKQATDLSTEFQAGASDVDIGTTRPAGPSIVGSGGYSAPSQQTIDASTGRTISVPLGEGMSLGEAQGEHSPGFLATRGEDALAKVDERNKKIEELRAKIAEKATSEFAKKKFLEESGRLMESYRERANQHVAHEVERGKADSIKSGLSEAERQMAQDPLNEKLAAELVGSLSGRTEAMLHGRSKEVVEDALNDIRAKVAVARAGTLIEQGEYGAAQMVVNGSRLALGRTANELDAHIKRGLAAKLEDSAAAEAQEVAAGIVTSAKIGPSQSDAVAIGALSSERAAANLARPDAMFQPIDLQAVEELVATVPPEKRKKVKVALDELVAQDAKRVKEAKERFVDGAKTQFSQQRGAFFNSSTAKALEAVDPDAYFTLEDRWKSANRLARTEGREKQKLEKELTESAMDDLKTRLQTDPTLDVGKFMREHPEVPATKVNGFSYEAARAAKVYEAGLKPTMDKFAEDYEQEASNKMPEFTGTPQQMRDQRAAWRRERHNEAVDMYTSEVEANKGEKPDATKLIERKAEAIKSLPLSSTPRGMAADVKAAVEAVAPPARKPKSVAGPRATGRTVTRADGSVWGEMSEGPARMISPPKKKGK